MIKVTLETEKENGEIEVTYMELDNIAFAGKHFDEDSVVSAVVGRYSMLDKMAIAHCLKTGLVKEVISGVGEELLDEFLSAIGNSEGGFYFE